MLRRVLRVALGGLLRIFFRRIEVAGAHRVPDRGPVLFAVNHPNALVDPLLLLCHAPRPVSFIAKAPLLTMPVVGWFARALDTIPVHRRQDPAADPARNRETFARARALLERGGAIAIAPEGTSHSEPGLRPLKTGAARLALGVGTAEPVRLVPAGLFYTRKDRFRSAALLLFGDPIVVAPAPLDATGEPPPDRVAGVTAALERALAAVVLQADKHEALALAARVERLLAAGPASGRSLAEVHAIRRRLLNGYRLLRERAPQELAALRQRAERLEAAFGREGLEPRHLAAPFHGLGAIGRGTAILLARVLLFLPLALPGAVLHYPAYRLVGWLAARYAGRDEDVLATAKIIAAAGLFPLTWLAAAGAAAAGLGWRAGVAALLVAPLSGYAALRLGERLERFRSVGRALGLYLFERETFGRLARARDLFRDELLELAARLGV